MFLSGCNRSVFQHSGTSCFIVLPRSIRLRRCRNLRRAATAIDESPLLLSKPSLKPPPSRPPPEISRAPPSPRTRLAKERNTNSDNGDRYNGNGSSGGGGVNGNGASGPLQRPSPSNAQRPSPYNRQRSPPSEGQRPSQPGGQREATNKASEASPRSGPAAPLKNGLKAKPKGKGGKSADAVDEFGKRRKAKVVGKVDVSNRRQARQRRKQEREEVKKAGASVREEAIEVSSEGMAVAELAEKLAINPAEIVKTLFMKGVMVQVNQVISQEAVKVVAEEFGVEVLEKDDAEVTDMAKKSVDFMVDDDLEFLESRPPVVAVLGHVDHGKTSLLDFIRKAKVAAGEAGGITQSIGAYTCSVNTLEGEKQVTFLDTPGHEAFSAMRARGARVTDVAIVICAADDGVQPQTVEAIGHAKAAGVPIVVAINKCDKPESNAERVKQQMAENGLMCEEWGGSTPMVEISAKTGTGVDDLLETIALIAEMEELLSNPTRAAAGTVIEAHLDKKVGPLATVLVQAGTLKVGDMVCAGSSAGHVRSMRDTGGEVRLAGPSIAVQVLGLNSVPDAGDTFQVYEDESEAREAAAEALQKSRMQRLADQAGGGSVVTLSSLATIDEDTEALQRINVILKGDASGTVEAVKGALQSLPSDSVMLRFLLAAPGDISISDINLAAAAQGMVVGFNVTPSEAVMAEAKRAGVTLRTYDVIYDLIDDVRAVMEGQLKAVEERVYLGEATVKAVFGAGARRVAGCAVLDGVLRKDSVIEVTRGKKVVYDGPLVSLRRVKDDVKEVNAGTECGAGAQGFADWKEGDKIRCYEVIEKYRKLEEASATSVMELMT